MLATIALYLHYAGLLLAFCSIVIADNVGFSWMRGRVLLLTPQTLHRLHQFVGLALGLLIGSGLILFWPMREYLLGQPLFYLKLTFVATLVVNAFVIDQLMHVATKKPFRTLTPREKRPLFISAAVSTICWVGTVSVALYIFGWPF